MVKPFLFADAISTSKLIPVNMYNTCIYKVVISV